MAEKLQRPIEKRGFKNFFLGNAYRKEATISYTDGSDQTVTLNLWQQNMFAVRFEIELAFMVRDINKFVLLTGSTPEATTTSTGE